MNLANKITIARLALAPIIFFLIIFGKNIAAIVLIVIAFLTDIADGYIARRLKQETRLGKILDAAADKIFVFLVIFALLWIFGNEKTNLVYMLMFFSKDILNFIFYVSSARFRKSKKHSRPLGKLTTALQALTIFWVILGLSHYEYLVYLVFAVGIVASVDYFLAFRGNIKKRR